MTAPATTPADSTSTAPSGSPTSEPRAPEPYRFPDTHPKVWARGKTAEEVLALTEQLDQTLQQVTRQPQVQPPAPPQKQGFDIGDDDYVQGRQVKQILEHYQNRPDPYAQRAFQAASETALRVLEQNASNKEPFERFGPEIRATVAQMPPETRTLDNLQAAVDYVVGKHWRDLVASEAQRFVAENPTMRSTGGAGSGSHIPNTQRDLGVLENPAIPEDQRHRLKALGLTEHQITEFRLANNNMSADEFVQLYAPIKGPRAIEVEPSSTKLRTV